MPAVAGVAQLVEQWFCNKTLEWLIQRILLGFQPLAGPLVAVLVGFVPLPV
jgi:hypothetical protein